MCASVKGQPGFQRETLKGSHQTDANMLVFVTMSVRPCFTCGSFEKATGIRFLHSSRCEDSMAAIIKLRPSVHDSVGTLPEMGCHH